MNNKVVMKEKAAKNFRAKRSAVKKDKVVSIKKDIQEFKDTPLSAQLTDTEMLFYIACHPETPGKILAKLSTHPNIGIRRAVASNLQTSASTLYQLIREDTDEDVIRHAEKSLEVLAARDESIRKALEARRLLHLPTGIVIIKEVHWFKRFINAITPTWF